MCLGVGIRSKLGQRLIYGSQPESEQFEKGQEGEDNASCILKGNLVLGIQIEKQNLLVNGDKRVYGPFWSLQ